MTSLVTTWLPIRDADPRGFGHYMRHYSSKKVRAGRDFKRWRPNGRRYIGNGKHLSLLTVDCRAHIAWRLQRYRLDGQYGVECCIFRNESPTRSSDLIAEAVALAREVWPDERLFTYVDPKEVRRYNARHRNARPVGYCFAMAGWTPVPNVGAKWVWELLP